MHAAYCTMLSLLIYRLSPLVDRKIIEDKDPAVSGFRTGPVPWQQLSDFLGSIQDMREKHCSRFVSELPLLIMKLGLGIILETYKAFEVGMGEQAVSRYGIITC